MVLGALIDLGLPLDELRAALGSLAIEYGEIAAERVLRAGVSATKFRATADAGGAAEPHRPDHDHAHHDHATSRTVTRTSAFATPRRAATGRVRPRAFDQHPHHSLAEIRSGDRPVGAVAGREGSRGPPVRAAGRSGVRHSRRAGRPDPSPRSRRPRLDHRHRRRGARDGVARRRRSGGVAVECRERDRPVRARGVPGAGASHRADPRRRADLCRRRRRRSW